MTERTTVNKLRRYRNMVEAKENGTSWWVNPNDHSLPSLPEQENLEQEYLEAVLASCPEIAEEVRDLIALVKDLR